MSNCEILEREPGAKPMEGQPSFPCPALKASDMVMVSVTPDATDELWAPAIVTQVFSDQGTCNVLTFLPGGTRPRYALHYHLDPRLSEHPFWLPPENPDAGVWKLSRREELLRSAIRKMGLLEERLVQLSEQIAKGRQAEAAPQIRRKPGRPPNLPQVGKPLTTEPTV